MNNLELCFFIIAIISMVLGGVFIFLIEVKKINFKFESLMLLFLMVVIPTIFFLLLEIMKDIE